MTADREQTRRDATPELLRELAAAVDKDRGHEKSLLTRTMRKAAAELEQAERERDEALKHERQSEADRDHVHQRNLMLEARLAKVPALVEALRRIADDTNIFYNRRVIARDALAAYEQEQA